jgi:DNA-binding transcriptional ArsR family regulator
MSQTLLAPLGTPRQEDATGRRTDELTDDEVARLLDVLDDAGCRAILEATGRTALSASELSERCGVPLSTTYRKLDALTDVGVLAEGLRVRLSGTHTREYSRRVESVEITIDDVDGLTAHVTLVAPAERVAGARGVEAD